MRHQWTRVLLGMVLLAGVPAVARAADPPVVQPTASPQRAMPLEPRRGDGFDIQVPKGWVDNPTTRFRSGRMTRLLAVATSNVREPDAGVYVFVDPRLGAEADQAIDMMRFMLTQDGETLVQRYTRPDRPGLWGFQFIDPDDDHMEGHVFFETKGEQLYSVLIMARSGRMPSGTPRAIAETFHLR